MILNKFSLNFTFHSSIQLTIRSVNTWADEVEKISRTGFIDKTHQALLDKVQDPVEGISFKDFQSDVKSLMDYVTSKKSTMSPEEWNVWKNRDYELIKEAREMVIEESQMSKEPQTSKDSEVTMDLEEVGEKRKADSYDIEKDKPADTKPRIEVTSPENKSSLLEDFADNSTEMPDYTDPD